MKTIDSRLDRVEEKWLPDLFYYCKEVFKESYLPSHDENHHLRVWHIAKNLIKELELEGYTFTISKIERIILTLFFHDTGMSVQTGPDHGKYSRKIAERFFESLEKSIEGKEEILTVIEKHDEKEYRNRSQEVSHAPDSLFSLVSTSDDLDAFGITGIYRYAEIYLWRGVSFTDLSNKILENSKNRYHFFIDVYGFLERFVAKQMIRYQILQKFFSDLLLQQKTGNISFEAGPAGVIKRIEKLVVKDRSPIQEVFIKVNNDTKDPYVLDFFRLLKKEMGHSNSNTLITL